MTSTLFGTRCRLQAAFTSVLNVHWFASTWVSGECTCLILFGSSFTSSINLLTSASDTSLACEHLFLILNKERRYTTLDIFVWLYFVFLSWDYYDLIVARNGK